MENSTPEVVDADRSDDIGGEGIEAGVLGSIDIEVDEPTSSQEARQNNGVYAPGTMPIKLRVKKPKAEGTSIQNNGVIGVVGKDNFWARS
jgi:hypothetical protein